MIIDKFHADASTDHHASIHRTWERHHVFPFTAIEGQDRMKKALMLNAICPSIGGVLIRGEKGTAKSTAVRGLAGLLPEIVMVADCPFSCDPGKNLCATCRNKLQNDGMLVSTRKKMPLVDLPLGVTEDRVAGTIDFTKAVKDGKREFLPGLLASAHRGILYIDEVNLLHDHIVDIILDASATGINVVEREGMSFCHPAEFILIGTMNPEEGELRPQLLDRFGLCVDISAPKDIAQRLSVLKLRERFDDCPAIFIETYQTRQHKLMQSLVKAKELFPFVDISDKMTRLCLQLAKDAFVAGHRADIILHKTARAIAIMDGRMNVLENDVYEAAAFTLMHRKRHAPSPPPTESENQHDQEDEQQPSSEQEREDNANHEPSSSSSSEEMTSDNNQTDACNASNLSKTENTDSENNPSSSLPKQETVFPIGSPFRVKPLSVKRDRKARKGSGRRTRSRTTQKLGRYVRSRRNEAPDDFALDATLRAAAPYQPDREKNGVMLSIKSQDLHQKIREKLIGNLIVFVVDASGSMGAEKRMIETKAAVFSLLLDAYQKRDKVALVAFRGDNADILLPPTNSVELAYKLLEELPTGGKTPLSHGIALGYQVIDNQLQKNPNTYPIMVIISDGKGNVSISGQKPMKETMDIVSHIYEDGRIKSVVIDVEKAGLISFELAKQLAEKLDGFYFKIDELKADTLIDVLKQNVISV